MEQIVDNEHRVFFVDNNGMFEGRQDQWDNLA